MEIGEESGTSRSLFRFVERIVAAEDLPEALQATQSYLNSWPREWILRVQSVDGGWAPFDQGQQPSRINGVADLQRIQGAVHRQCVALRQSGFKLIPELVELDEVLFVAVRAADSLATRESRAVPQAA